MGVSFPSLLSAITGGTSLLCFALFLLGILVAMAFRAHKVGLISSSAADQVGLNGPEMTALSFLQALALR